jgi:hypothetical protein
MTDARGRDLQVRLPTLSRLDPPIRVRASNDDALRLRELVG